MTSPLGYYHYLRGNIDGLLPAQPRKARGPAADHRQELGLCLIVVATTLPVLVAGAVVLALNLLA
jgi:hypothetical protein